MNFLDKSILEFLSHSRFHSEAFDCMALEVAMSLLLKGGVTMAVIWWLWFRDRGETASAKARRTIVAGFVGTILALSITRAAVTVLPHRDRPVAHPELFPQPYGPLRNTDD